MGKGNRNREGRNRTLLILPSIPDELPAAVKDGLAIRNAASTNGVCPDCGAVPVIAADPDYPLIFHATFEHEDTCGALTDS